MLGVGYYQGSTVYRYVVAELDNTLKAGNPNLVFSNSVQHGFLVVDVGADQVQATYHLIPSSEVNKDYSKRPDAELQGKFTTQSFRVRNGTITPA